MNLITQNLKDCLEKNILISIINQLNKDFAQSNVAIDIDITSSPEQIAQLLTTKIESIIQFNEIDIRSLLYRIDVSELKIKNLRIFSSEDIALLIVERIIDKVKMRALYSK